MSAATLLSYVWTAVVFLTMISILVAAHEYGHYFFARLFGMGVEEFSIGMGKRLKVWGRKRYDIPVAADFQQEKNAPSAGSALEGGTLQRESEVIDTDRGRILRETTDFTVRMLPIGGFVRIKGMMPEEDGSETKIAGGFYNKPPWQRLIVLFAGPVASVVSGVIVLALLFMIHGVERPTHSTVIGSLDTTQVAAKAGLHAGDRILSIDGHPTNNFYDIVERIYPSAGKKLTVVFEHKGETQTTTLVPEAKEGLMLGPDLEIKPGGPQMRGAIGVGMETHLVRLGVAEAFVEALRYPIEAVQGMIRVVTHPAKLKDEAGGAVTMVAATYEATQAGPASVVGLACLLSISVGIFNLLPFPPLDGGQMLIAVAELLRRGRRLSIQVQNALMGAGLAVVLLLAVVVLFIDIQRFTKPANEQPPKRDNIQKMEDAPPSNANR